MNEVNVEQAARIFERAAAYIRKYGWQVSGMSSHGKPRCSMGALESASFTKKWDPTMAQLMYEQLYLQLNGLSLTEFNEKYRSGEKVARLFSQTAQTLRVSRLQASH